MPDTLTIAVDAPAWGLTPKEAGWALVVGLRRAKFVGPWMHMAPTVMWGVEGPRGFVEIHGGARLIPPVPPMAGDEYKAEMRRIAAAWRAKMERAGKPPWGEVEDDG